MGQKSSMNRRGFFGGLAALAIAPFVSRPRGVWSRRVFRVPPIVTPVDHGGYLVPPVFVPVIKSTQLNQPVIRGRLLTAPESRIMVNGGRTRITLRTIDGQTITRDICNG